MYRSRFQFSWSHVLLIMISTSAWGWIPNLSGVVSVESRLNDVLSKTDLKNLKIKLISDRTYIVVSNDFDKDITIDVVDDKGLCKINYQYDDDKYDETIIAVESLWRSFRRIFDGCSNTSCNCTAMASLYHPGKKQGMIHADVAKDEYHGLARMFLENIEAITDSCYYIFSTNDPRIGLSINDNTWWRIAMDQTIRSDSLYRSDYVYFKRFMVFYSSKFTQEEYNEYLDHMSSRVEKVQIAIDDACGKLSSKHDADSLTIALKSLKEAKWSALFAAIAAIAALLSIIVPMFM